jgi:lipopolysaccharide export LptBFGC system permease protein LptF
MSARVIGQFLLYLVPVELKYTIPLALLCATVLVFSRLSADRELIAMRASGVSLWQIVAPALLLAVALSGVCFYLQTSLGPRCLYYADQVKRQELVRSPLALLDAGFVEFPGYALYIGSREGNRLHDVTIYGLGKDGRATQDITAREGVVRNDERTQTLVLELKRATIAALDPAASGPGRNQWLAGQTCSITLDYGRELNDRPLARKEKHLDIAGILSCLRVYSERGIPTDPLYVALHSRMSMALSPLAFLLIGIPFGVRTQRSETSIGLLVSLVLALFFHVFVILANSLKDQVGYHPEVLVWLPNVLYQVGGLLALRRVARF